MSDQADRAADIEQRYVQEHEEIEGVVEGLDPERPDEQQSTDQVKAVAPDERAEEHVERMADDD